MERRRGWEFLEVNTLQMETENFMTKKCKVDGSRMPRYEVICESNFKFLKISKNQISTVCYKRFSLDSK